MPDPNPTTNNTAAASGQATGAVTPWFNSYPTLSGNEDAKGVLGRYKSADDALMGLVNAQKRLSAPLVLPEKLDEFQPAQRKDLSERMMKLLGLPEGMLSIPDKPESYVLNRPADWPKDIPFSESLEKSFRELLVQDHIHPAAAQHLYDLHNSTVRAAYEGAAKARVDAAAKAEQELSGPSGFGTKEALASALTFIQRAFGHAAEDLKIPQEQMIAALTETGCGNNVVMTRVLHRFASQLEKEGATQAQTRLGDAKSLRQQWFPNSPQMDGSQA